MKVCSNCGRQVQTATEFDCPGCRKTRVVRCATCRKEKNSYSCAECGFQGP
ncbi:MAG: zinc finger domain-containing protein [Candidatus Norongarragalinales archaeon]